LGALAGVLTPSAFDEEPSEPLAPTEDLSTHEGDIVRDGWGVSEIVMAGVDTVADLRCSRTVVFSLVAGPRANQDTGDITAGRAFIRDQSGVVLEIAREELFPTNRKVHFRRKWPSKFKLPPFGRRVFVSRICRRNTHGMFFWMIGG
jgi:hypothetical protein